VKVGDLVQKRWGRIKPYQQGTVAVNLGVPAAGHETLIRVAYPNGKKTVGRAEEFEVVSESR
jgi:hypothetical protein